MTRSVRPKPVGATPATLSLTPEEGFVLSRIDGQLTTKDLVALTGIDEGRIEQIVTKLANEGAVQLEGYESSQRLPDVPSDAALPKDHSTASLAEFAAALGMDPTTFAADRSRPALEEPVEEARVESRSNYPPPAVHEDSNPSMEEIPTLDPDIHGVSEEEEQAAQADRAEAENDPLPPPSDSNPTLGLTPEAGEAAEEEDPNTAEATKNYRKLYQEKFHVMTTDLRVTTAHTAQGADLFALCLDPEPRVIAAILENHTVGLDHVRMIAFHHRTGTGLEIMARRQDWLRDLQVERRLLRNPMSPEQVTARILNPKNLLVTYKLMVDREIPELTRTRIRGHFRKKWTTAPPEDRAELMLRTEGRPLIYMTGCTFDARTTQIICGKVIASMLLIQNFAKFPATPPGILAHLMKQAFVRKNPGMRKLLLQHPNMPGEVKRSF
jgi:hypothetical protein